MAAALKPRSDTPTIARPGCAAPPHPVPVPPMPNIENLPSRPSPNPPYSPPRSATPSTPSSPPTYGAVAAAACGPGGVGTGDPLEIDCPACRLQVEVTSSSVLDSLSQNWNSLGNLLRNHLFLLH